MKFTGLSKTEEITGKDILKEEFKAAVRSGEGRMGQEHLFYRLFYHYQECFLPEDTAGLPQRGER